MNIYVVIFGIVIIVTVPIAFLLGGKAYLTLLVLMAFIILLALGLYYVYWYIFHKLEI